MDLFLFPLSSSEAERDKLPVNITNIDTVDWQDPLYDGYGFIYFYFKQERESNPRRADVTWKVATSTFQRELDHVMSQLKSAKIIC